MDRVEEKPLKLEKTKGIWEKTDIPPAISTKRFRAETQRIKEKRLREATDFLTGTGEMSRRRRKARKRRIS